MTTKYLHNTKYNLLKTTLTTKATLDLINIAPQYVEGFNRAVKEIKYYESPFPKVLHNCSTMNKWRIVCIDLFDVEVQQHRLENCFILAESNAQSSLNEGEWLEYNFDYWSILLQGYLHRVEKLTKNILRKIVIPKDPNIGRDIDTILSTLKIYKNNISKVRDPVAHTGGPVEVLGRDDLLGNYILLQGNFDIKGILGAFANRKKDWLSKMQEFTSLATEETDNVFGRITDLIDQ